MRNKHILCLLPLICVLCGSGVEAKAPTLTAEQNSREAYKDRKLADSADSKGNDNTVHRKQEQAHMQAAKEMEANTSSPKERYTETHEHLNKAQKAINQNNKIAAGRYLKDAISSFLTKLLRLK